MSSIHLAHTKNISMKKSIIENENTRLQKQADGFTKKLEHEKRRQLMLEDQQKEKIKKVEEKKKVVCELKPNTLDYQKRISEIKKIENTLDKSINKYNTIVNDNAKLKNKIDSLRHELAVANSAYKKLNESILKKEKNALKNSAERIKDNTLAEETNIQIHALRSKHNKDKSEFNSRLSELKGRIKEREEIRKSEERERSPKSSNKKVIADKNLYFNPLEVLNLRIEKWKNSNNEKRKIIDQYIKNSKIIQDAFEQISSLTGYYNIDDIVSTFIKSENQNNQLYNFANNLSQEVEDLEAENRKLKNTIKELDEEENRKISRMSQEEIMASKELDEIKASIKSKKEQIHQFRQLCKRIQQPYSEIVNIFNKANVILTVKSNLIFNNTTFFNEQNILGYLSIFEEYLDNLLTSACKQKNIENPIHAVLPLEKLKQKLAFHKKKKIEPPLIKMSKDDELSGDKLNVIFDKRELYHNVSRIYEENYKKSEKLKEDQIEEENESIHEASKNQLQGNSNDDSPTPKVKIVVEEKSKMEAKDEIV